ncbi:riboflavin synthase [Dermacoccaceae bacterium W4C1]
MFTGIVEELGTVAEVRHRDGAAVLVVDGPLVTSDARRGDSIAVNGVCLTVTEVDGQRFTADVMAQTLSLSGLGTLVAGDRINLERAMSANGRFGGHLVSGHVDATTTVLRRVPGSAWEVVTFALPPEVAHYFVPQGSITVDGVSLTISRVSQGDQEFDVSLIPTTLAATTLGTRAVGDPVNLEVDQVAKYLHHLAAPHLGATSGGAR